VYLNIITFRPYHLKYCNTLIEHSDLYMRFLILSIFTLNFEIMILMRLYFKFAF